MPELPEVETVRRGLTKFLPGKKIEQVVVLHPRATRKSDVSLSDCVGARIDSVNRRGKFLWFTLENNRAIVGHLGMSGQMLVQKSSDPISSHARVLIRFAGSFNEFRFIDQRTFGWLSVDTLVDSEFGPIPESCAHIAPDPFDEQFDLDAAIDRLANRNTEIKRALLNQEIISGIGNIYADEALWLSKIHPERKVENLNSVELKALIRNATKVMRKSLKSGGTSFDDLYIDVNGESGYYEISLKAYGREGEPCARCKKRIRRIAFANRSSHYCPNCQRAPRRRGKPPTSH